MRKVQACLLRLWQWLQRGKRGVLRGARLRGVCVHVRLLLMLRTLCMLLWILWVPLARLWRAPVAAGLPMCAHGWRCG